MNKFLYVAASILLSGCVSLSKYNKTVERLQDKIISSDVSLLKCRDHIEVLEAAKLRCLETSRRIDGELKICLDQEYELKRILKEECSYDDDVDDGDYGC